VNFFVTVIKVTSTGI